MADGYARAGGRPGVAMVVPGRRRLQRGVGPGDRLRLLLAGAADRRPGQPGTASGATSGCCTTCTTSSTSSARSRNGPQPGRARRTASRQPCTRRSARCWPAGRGPTEIEVPPEAFAEATAAPLRAGRGTAAAAAGPGRHRAGRGRCWRGATRRSSSPAAAWCSATPTAELTAVAEQLQAPVVTTREGKGAIDDRHPLSVGTMWVNRRLRPILDAADVVLAVGSRVQGFGLRPDQRLIHIDADPDQIGRNSPAAVAVAGRRPAGAVGTGRRAAGAAGRSRAEEVRRDARDGAGASCTASGRSSRWSTRCGPASPRTASSCATRRRSRTRATWPIPCTRPRTYLSTSYMGTLGFGFPAALGAKVACPDRPVVTVVGDGGFLFASNELATAVQHDIHDGHGGLRRRGLRQLQPRPAREVRRPRARHARCAIPTG